MESFTGFSYLESWNHLPSWNNYHLLALVVFNDSMQCESPKIAKLVYNSDFTMVYGTYNIL